MELQHRADVGRRPTVVAAVSPDDDDRLLRTAWQRARALEADLTICTAIAEASAATMIAVEAIADRILSTAPRDVMIRFDVRPGPVSQQILACARELDAAQIIVGQVPRSTPARLAHTGICTALLHDATCPLLIAGPSRGTRRILVATDLTDAGAPVLQAAAREARRDDGAVTALHCVPIGASHDDVRQRLATRLDEVGLVAAEPRIANASVARAILETATALDVDLIVMGSHAHSTAERLPVTRHHRAGLERVLCGSAAARVAREAPCSVLLVPVDDPPR